MSNSRAFEAQAPLSRAFEALHNAAAHLFNATSVRAALSGSCSQPANVSFDVCSPLSNPATGSESLVNTFASSGNRSEGSSIAYHFHSIRMDPHNGALMSREHFLSVAHAFLHHGHSLLAMGAQVGVCKVQTMNIKGCRLAVLFCSLSDGNAW